jgi:two-component system cell cycle response regulator DivK
MKTTSARPLVLIVDDYSDGREMYSEYLQFSGFDVVEAANGIEALERALEAAPDIILMDLALPVMDGWEATRRLKADPRTAAIPVVALTGHAMAGTSDGVEKAGCDAYVVKPCLPEDLVKAICTILESCSPSASQSASPPTTQKIRRSGKHPKGAR